MPDALESQFHEAMLDIYRRAKVEAKYNASVFLQMVVDQGGLQAARTLINSKDPSSGYTRLWELNRLDLSVEAVVLQTSDFHTLFTEQELEICKKRLRDYGYKF
ncbi:MAG: hypothetical protein F4058_03985 [Rhodothermaceae bacterium]|nr:hypothetical protein [Gammaproteobacteria bacterium]MYH84383.1 hypothetical protein [Gammaproteobacteria bacterium]MYI84478.1 hypothetical protein [Rhodothermaceae bacterium]